MRALFLFPPSCPALPGVRAHSCLGALGDRWKCKRCFLQSCTAGLVPTNTDTVPQCPLLLLVRKSLSQRCSGQTGSTLGCGWFLLKQTSVRFWCLQVKLFHFQSKLPPLGLPALGPPRVQLHAPYLVLSVRLVPSDRTVRAVIGHSLCSTRSLVVMDKRNRGTWSSVLGAHLLRLFSILWEQPKGEDGAAVWPPLWDWGGHCDTPGSLRFNWLVAATL